MRLEETVSIGEFSTHTMYWFDKMRTTGQPVRITEQSGELAGILLTSHDYDTMLERERFLSAVATGMADAENGNTFDTPTVKRMFELE